MELVEDEDGLVIPRAVRRRHPKSEPPMRKTNQHGPRVAELSVKAYGKSTEARRKSLIKLKNWICSCSDPGPVRHHYDRSRGR